jgi:hypothetical protein
MATFISNAKRMVNKLKANWHTLSHPAKIAALEAILREVQSEIDHHQPQTLGVHVRDSLGVQDRMG